MIEYVLGLLFSPDRRHVLLIRKRRPVWQAGRLNGIGGHLAEGEAPCVAMEREAVEEAGAGGLDWQHFATLRDRNQDYRVYCFAAFDAAIWRAEARTNEALETHLAWHVQVRDDVLANLPVLVALAADRSGIVLPVALDHAELPGE